MPSTALNHSLHAAQSKAQNPESEATQKSLVWLLFHPHIFHYPPPCTLTQGGALRAPPPSPRPEGGRRWSPASPPPVATHPVIMLLAADCSVEANGAGAVAAVGDDVVAAQQAAQLQGEGRERGHLCLERAGLAPVLLAGLGLLCAGLVQAPQRRMGLQPAAGSTRRLPPTTRGTHHRAARWAGPGAAGRTPPPQAPGPAPARCRSRRWRWGPPWPAAAGCAASSSRPLGKVVQPGRLRPGERAL